MISNFLFGTSFLAIGCGLLQSIPDERNAARAYLLHRGVSAGQSSGQNPWFHFLLISIAVAVPLALVRMVAGAAWCVACSRQANSNGTTALIAFCAWTFYPAILLIIYRPARWLGSRVAPIMLPIGHCGIAICNWILVPNLARCSQSCS